MTLKLIGDLDNISTVIVTKISPKDEVIIDFVLNDVLVSKDTSGVSFVTNSPSKQIAIFELVDFLHPDSVSLFDLFRKYDGQIIALDNEEFFKRNRQDINIDTFPESYIITAY